MWFRRNHSFIHHDAQVVYTKVPRGPYKKKCDRQTLGKNDP